MEMHRNARECNFMIFFWHLSGTRIPAHRDMMGRASAGPAAFRDALCARQRWGRPPARRLGLGARLRTTSALRGIGYPLNAADAAPFAENGNGGGFKVLRKIVGHRLDSVERCITFFKMSCRRESPKNQWGGAREGAGRPKSKENCRRDRVTVFRLSVSEKQAVQQQAIRSGLQLSHWIRQTLLTAANFT